ncbi:VOC family protein [Comamonas flocculans]|uniref:VOC family protein n=1 Tax=Comamonas flocculans TaxID=2597701 RepID=A0A5B8RTP2_9BURK|nr:VOC family protein [Comamonas flocculans]QEA12861.1 VOC family protein [Comamonas flocculans]
MFSHVILGSNDLERAKRFYDAFFGALGVGPAVFDRYRYFYRSGGGTFGITTPIDGQPASVGNGGTLGFAAASPEQAQAAHDAAVAAGGSSCEDPPGWRESGKHRIYLAYLRDPDGNKLCLLHRPAREAH